MNFIKKHPYIFFQCLGALILVIDFIYILFNLNNDYISYAFIVLSGMLGFMIIILSPFVIKRHKQLKDPKEIEASCLYGYIERWYVKTYGRKKAIVVLITMFIIFVGGTMVLTYCGLPFIAWLLFYPDAFIYYQWKKYVKNNFYKVPKGDKRFKFIKVQNLEFLNSLLIQDGICYRVRISEEMLNFLYNRFYNASLLKYNTLTIYVISNKLLNEKYANFEHRVMDDNEYILFILADELNLEVTSIKDIVSIDNEIGGCLYYVR